MVGNLVGLFLFQCWKASQRHSCIITESSEEFPESYSQGGSVSPGMGNICSIITRFLSMEIAYRQSLNVKFLMSAILSTMYTFWKTPRYLHMPTKISVIIYTLTRVVSRHEHILLKLALKCFIWHGKSLKKVWAQLGESSEQIELSLASFKEQRS